MTTYRVEFGNGMRSEDFTSLAAVKRRIRVPGGKRARVFLSEWFSDTYSGQWTQACCAYYSRKDRDEDQDGAHAIRITQIPAGMA